MSENKPVIVIAGGWSFKPYFSHDFRQYGTVIGVNDASIHTAVHIAVSMDRLWVEHRRETLDFLNIPVHYRVCKNGPPPHLGIQFKCNNKMDEAMTLAPAELWGNNSGAVALNLAFKVTSCPGRVYLFGYDMMNGPHGEQHWYRSYPWKQGGGSSDGKLRQWSQEFAPFAKQFADSNIVVKNVTTRSALNNWPKITFEQFKKEVQSG